MPTKIESADEKGRIETALERGRIIGLEEVRQQIIWAKEEGLNIDLLDWIDRRIDSLCLLDEAVHDGG